MDNPTPVFVFMFSRGFNMRVERVWWKFWTWFDI